MKLTERLDNCLEAIEDAICENPVLFSGTGAICFWLAFVSNFFYGVVFCANLFVGIVLTYHAGYFTWFRVKDILEKRRKQD